MGLIKSRIFFSSNVTQPVNKVSDSQCAGVSNSNQNQHEISYPVENNDFWREKNKNDNHTSTKHGCNGSITKEDSRIVAWIKEQSYNSNSVNRLSTNALELRDFLHSLPVKVTKFKAFIEPKSIVTDEKSNFVLKYKTPHFRASATVECSSHLVEPTCRLQVGWVQVCTELHFYNIYGSEGLTSWELPGLVLGDVEMVSDSERQCGPWYGRCAQLIPQSDQSDDPSDPLLCATVKMNDNFHPQVTWYIPCSDYDRDPKLSRVFRRQSFITCLVISRDSAPGPSSFNSIPMKYSPSSQPSLVDSPDQQKRCTQLVKNQQTSTRQTVLGEESTHRQNKTNTSKIHQNTSRNNGIHQNAPEYINLSQNTENNNSSNYDNYDRTLKDIRILKAVKWSFKIDIELDSSRARGRRTLRVSPDLQDQPEELSGEALGFLEHKIRDLSDASANDSQVLMWRSLDGQSSVIVPAADPCTDTAEYAMSTSGYCDDIKQYLKKFRVDLEKFQ